MDEAGEFMMYSRAYFWIEECKLRSKEWKLALKNISSDKFIMCSKTYLYIILKVQKNMRNALI
jgi:hypothetical protein